MSYAMASVYVLAFSVVILVGCSIYSLRSSMRSQWQLREQLAQAVMRSARWEKAANEWKAAAKSFEEAAARNEKTARDLLATLKERNAA